MKATANNQLQIIRIFDAPVELVWEAWTNPDYLAQWWGPNGFTTTIHQMNVKAGEEWRLTMHSPDGQNFPNRSIFKEVILHRKIVFEHFNPNFITTVIFEAQGDKTSMQWTMVFENAEMLETIVKAHKADKGLEQNVEKLEKYLSQLKQ